MVWAAWFCSASVQGVFLNTFFPPELCIQASGERSLFETEMISLFSCAGVCTPSKSSTWQKKVPDEAWQANSQCHGVFALGLVWGGGCVWACSWKHRPGAGQDLAGSCGCPTVPWHLFQPSFNWLQPEFAFCLFFFWHSSCGSYTHTQAVLTQQRRHGANLESTCGNSSFRGLIKTKDPELLGVLLCSEPGYCWDSPPPNHKLVFAFLLPHTFVCKGNTAIALHKHFPNARFTQKLMFCISGFNLFFHTLIFSFFGVLSPQRRICLFVFSCQLLGYLCLLFLSAKVNAVGQTQLWCNYIGLNVQHCHTFMLHFNVNY